MSAWLSRKANYAPAVVFIVLYFIYDREILNLFAATFCVIHAKGDEILEAIEKGKK